MRLVRLPCRPGAAFPVLLLALIAGCGGPQSDFLEPFPADWLEQPHAVFPHTEDPEPRWIGWSVPADSPVVFGARDVVARLDPVEATLADLLPRLRSGGSIGTSWTEAFLSAQAHPGRVTHQARCAARAILANRTTGEAGPETARVFDDIILGRCGLPATTVVLGTSQRFDLFDDGLLVGVDMAIAERLGRNLARITIRLVGSPAVRAALQERADAEEMPDAFDWAVAWTRTIEGTTVELRSVVIAVPPISDTLALSPFPMLAEDGRFVIEGEAARDTDVPVAALFPLSGGASTTCVDDRLQAPPGGFRIVCVLPEAVDAALLDIGHLMPSGPTTSRYRSTARIPLVRGDTPLNRWGVAPPSMQRPVAEDPAERTVAWLNAILRSEGEPEVIWSPSLSRLNRMRQPAGSAMAPQTYARLHWRAPVFRSLDSSRALRGGPTHGDPWEAAVALRSSWAFLTVHHGRPPVLGLVLREQRDCPSLRDRCFHHEVLAVRAMEVEDPHAIEHAVRDQIDTWRGMLDLPPLGHASRRVDQQLSAEARRFRSTRKPSRRRIFATRTGPSHHFPRKAGVHPEYWTWWVTGPSDMVLPPELLAPDPPAAAIRAHRECNTRLRSCHDIVLIGVERPHTR